MAVLDRAALKAFFETGDKPTEAQFGDLIDSSTNIVDSVGYQFIKFSLTEPEVKALQTANGGFGFLLFAAPGAGKAIWITNVLYGDLSGVTWQGINTSLFIYAENQFNSQYTISVAPLVVPVEIVHPEMGSGGSTEFGNTAEDERIFLFTDNDQAAATGTLDVYVHFIVLTL